MVKPKDDNMGRFSVDIELANYDDIARARAGDISADDVRRLTIRGVVDSGATRLVIPDAVARRLGLEASGETVVRYGDGRTAQRRMATGIHLTCTGRSSLFNAVVEPGRDSALIGAIVLEDLDLVIDCTHQTLSPRDPRRIISEVE
jgi:predicted aspartyl protease